MTGKKVALISGAGMDSKTLTHLLLGKGYQVYVGTRRSTTFQSDKFKDLFVEDLQQNPGSSLKVLEMDIADQVSISSAIQNIVEQCGELNEIYHLAAASHVGHSYDHPYQNMHNGTSVIHFLECLRKISPKTRFYFAASTEMYAGNTSDGKYCEKDPFYPKTPYGCSKVLGFDLTRFYRETYGLFALSGILANHSNTYRHESFFIRKITKAAARIMLGKQKNVKIGHLDWARDEFWSDFGMEAAWKLLQLDKPQDVIIGNGNAIWGEEYVSNAFNYFNLKWQDYVVFDSAFLRKNEVVKLEVNPQKAVDLIGWKINRISFKEHVDFMCAFDYSSEAGLKAARPKVL